jgi:hypothetical protein
VECKTEHTVCDIVLVLLAVIVTGVPVVLETYWTSLSYVEMSCYQLGKSPKTEEELN